MIIDTKEDALLSLRPLAANIVTGQLPQKDPPLRRFFYSTPPLVVPTRAHLLCKHPLRPGPLFQFKSQFLHLTLSLVGPVL